MNSPDKPGADTGAQQLREYMVIIRRRKWTVAAAVAVVLLTASFFLFRQEPTYEAQADVLVKAASLSPDEVATGTGPNLQTERRLASSERVAQLVAEKLKTKANPRELLGQLMVGIAANTEILEVRYAHREPREAQRRAQAFAEAYLEYRRRQVLDDLLASTRSLQQRIENINGRLDDVNEELAATSDRTRRAALQAETNSLVSQLSVLQQKLSDLTPADDFRVGHIVAPADLPTSPSSPNYPLTLGLALCLGLLSGLGLALLTERLDERVRELSDFETHLRAPVLAVVPRIERPDNSTLTTVAEPHSAASEAYRSLRTGVLFDSFQRGTKTIMVTSAHAGEGKSTTVANLGVVLAQAGKQVMLVSADLRRPGLHRFFGLVSGMGLTEVLTGQASPRQAVPVPQVDNLRLLASGRIPPNPTDLLGSDGMRRVLAELRERVEFVLVDAPPVLVTADAATVASLVDGVLLVADAGDSASGVLEQVRRQLDQVNANVIGAVLNKFDPSEARTYPYYQSYYYETSRSQDAPAQLDTVDVSRSWQR